MSSIQEITSYRTRSRSRASTSHGGASLPSLPESPDSNRVESVETTERDPALDEMRTPKSRKRGSRTPTDSLRRVVTKSPYGERCIITLTKNPGLQFCYVVPRSTELEVVSRTILARDHFLKMLSSCIVSSTFGAIILENSMSTLAATSC